MDHSTLRPDVVQHKLSSLPLSKKHELTKPCDFEQHSNARNARAVLMTHLLMQIQLLVNSLVSQRKSCQCRCCEVYRTGRGRQNAKHGLEAPAESPQEAAAAFQGTASWLTVCGQAKASGTAHDSYVDRRGGSGCCQVAEGPSQGAGGGQQCQYQQDNHTGCPSLR